MPADPRRARRRGGCPPPAERGRGRHRLPLPQGPGRSLCCLPSGFSPPLAGTAGGAAPAGSGGRARDDRYLSSSSSRSAATIFGAPEPRADFSPSPVPPVTDGQSLQSTREIAGLRLLSGGGQATRGGAHGTAAGGVPAPRPASRTPEAGPRAGPLPRASEPPAAGAPGCIYPEKGGVGCRQSSLQSGKTETRGAVWRRAPPSGLRGPPSAGQGRRQRAAGAGFQCEPFLLL